MLEEDILFIDKNDIPLWNKIVWFAAAAHQQIVWMLCVGFAADNKPSPSWISEDATTD